MTPRMLRQWQWAVLTGGDCPPPQSVRALTIMMVGSCRRSTSVETAPSPPDPRGSWFSGGSETVVDGLELDRSASTETSLPAPAVAGLLHPRHDGRPQFLPRAPSLTIEDVLLEQVLTDEDEISGIDLNHCITDGALDPRTRKLVDATPNRLFVELSVRGGQAHVAHRVPWPLHTPAGAVLPVERSCSATRSPSPAEPRRGDVAAHPSTRPGPGPALALSPRSVGSTRD